MAGTLSSGRPGGNPDFGKKYKPVKLAKGDEVCDVPLSIRINQSTKEKLDQLSNKAQFCRDAIEAALKALEISE